MRLSSHLTFVVCTFVAASALAQPRAIRRRVRVVAPPARTHEPPPPPGRPFAPHMHGHRPHQNRQLCFARQSVLNQQQNRLDSLRSNLAGTQAEIRQLQMRLQQLQARRTDLSQRVANVQAVVTSQQATYNQFCQRDESCSQYEQLAANLNQQGQPLESQLGDIRNDMRSTQTAVMQTRSQIDPLRREYQQRACNNLIPGQTSQSTIDRCSAIFSQWNRLQGQINGYNSRLTNLKARYEEVTTSLANTERRAQGYETYLQAHCRQSRQLMALRRYAVVRDRAQRMGQQLDALIGQVVKLRAMDLGGRR